MWYNFEYTVKLGYSKLGYSELPLIMKNWIHFVGILGHFEGIFPGYNEHIFVQPKTYLENISISNRGLGLINKPLNSCWFK